MTVLIALARAAVLTVLVLSGTVAPARPAAAVEYTATPSNYLKKLRLLRGGDTLRLAAGRYAGGLPIHHMAGAPGSPIVIRGPRSGEAAILVARPRAHTISIINSAWVEIRDLELDGNGQRVAGVRAEGHSEWAHHITLDGLTIRGHGANQQIVGIAVFCPAWGWVIRNNRIFGAGTGMYLGTSDGGIPFVAGLIERNLVVDSLGYNVQIKHQHPRPRIEGMPEGPGTTIIRYNVFSKSATSSVEAARPNLLVGHWPPSGPGVEDTYAIYGNFFYQNPTEALFQGEGNIAFYSNVLVNSYGDAINIQPHNSVPRRIDVFRNTVLAAGSGIRVIGGHPEHAQRVVANAVFAQFPLSGGEQQANVAAEFERAAEYLANPHAEPGELVLAPRNGSLRIPAPDFAAPGGLPDAGRDFDGRAFAGPVAGAYSGPRALKPLRIEVPRKEMP